MAAKIAGRDGVPEKGWKVQQGAGEPKAGGTWKDHWLRNSGQSWPSLCSLFGRNNQAEAILIVQHPSLPGFFAVPVCRFCVKRTGEVALKPNSALVALR